MQLYDVIVAQQCRLHASNYVIDSMLHRWNPHNITSQITTLHFWTTIFPRQVHLIKNWFNFSYIFHNPPSSPYINIVLKLFGQWFLLLRLPYFSAYPVHHLYTSLWRLLRSSSGSAPEQFYGIAVPVWTYIADLRTSGQQASCVRPSRDTDIISFYTRLPDHRGRVSYF